MAQLVNGQAIDAEFSSYIFQRPADVPVLEHVASLGSEHIIGLNLLPCLAAA